MMQIQWNGESIYLLPAYPVSEVEVELWWLRVELWWFRLLGMIGEKTYKRLNF